MNATAFMKMKKVKGPRGVLDAALHNLREIPAGSRNHIDTSRSVLNYVLRGPSTAKGVEQLSMKLMVVAGINPESLRKDGVRVIETLYSLPVGTEIPHRPYFEDCVAETGRQVGDGNIISAAVHLDEAAWHLHVLTVPLVDGRMRGSDMVGGKDVLAARQKSFFDNVASKYGLAPPKKTGPAQKAATAKAVIQHLSSIADPAMKSVLWASIRDAIEAAPSSFADALGIRVPVVEKPKLTFEQIMTSPGKGPKWEPEEPNPIGVEDEPYRAVMPNPILCRVRR